MLLPNTLALLMSKCLLQYNFVTFGAEKEQAGASSI